jgi:hypothetical protein
MAITIAPAPSNTSVPSATSSLGSNPLVTLMEPAPPASGDVLADAPGPAMVAPSPDPVGAGDDDRLDVGERVEAGFGLGVAVEFAAGRWVGRGVDLVVGLVVAFAVGFGVDFGVESAVGRAVGGAVGAAVGGAVGATVGGAVGATVGGAVGTADGPGGGFFS